MTQRKSYRTITPYLMVGEVVEIPPYVERYIKDHGW